MVFVARVAREWRESGSTVYAPAEVEASIYDFSAMCNSLSHLILRSTPLEYLYIIRIYVVGCVVRFRMLTVYACGCSVRSIK